MVAKRWPKGKTSDEVRRQVGQFARIILNGKLVAIDPASRSAGWALYEKGELTDSGVITLPTSKPIHQRLRMLYDILVSREVPDVLAIEKIRGSKAHVYLMWSVGVSVSAVRAPIVLELPVNFWKVLRTEGYEKSDQADAELIGECIIELAREAYDV